MPTTADYSSNVKDLIVTEVSPGETAVLNCTSNDEFHNFLFWVLNNDNVIGPGIDYDDKKYKYKVLSGTLHMNNVLHQESGLYKCLSKNLNGSNINIGNVEMVVKNSQPDQTAIDTLKIVAIIISIIVIIGCVVIYYNLRKEWSKQRTVMSVDDMEDDGEDGEEVYNSTTTSINQPVPGPSRNQSSEQLLYGIDNQGLDIDFNSVFENIQIKSPQKSLI